MDLEQAQQAGGAPVGQGGPVADPGYLAPPAASAPRLLGAEPDGAHIGGEPVQAAAAGGGAELSSAGGEAAGQGGGAGAWSSGEQVIAGKHGGELRPVRTSEQGRELVNRRWAKVKAAARAEIAEYGGDGVLSGVRKMTRAQVQLAASGKPGSTSAYKAVLTVAELIERRQAGPVDGGPAVSVTLALNGQAAAGLAGLLGKLAGGQ